MIEEGANVNLESDVKSLRKKLQKLGLKKESAEAGDREFGADIYSKPSSHRHKKSRMRNEKRECLQ